MATPTTNPWSAGHSDKATCLSCGKRATSRPADGCAEQRHQHSYDRRREGNNDYRRRRRAEARAAGAVYRKGRGNPKTKAAYQQAKYEDARAELFRRLGGSVCVECGFADVRALALDHRAGGGRAHRKSLGGGAMGYTRALLAMSVADLRAMFQVLCANCNTIKRIENGEHHAPAFAA